MCGGTETDDSSPECRRIATSFTYGGRELLAFHWHPQGASVVKTPHLHVATDLQIGDRWLASAHLPTGQIALVDVLWLALEDFGVRPLRDDWRAVLERSRRG